MPPHDTAVRRPMAIARAAIARAAVLGLLATLLPGQSPEVPPHRRLDPALVAAVRDATGHEPFAAFAALARGELADGMDAFFDDRPEILDAAFAAAAVCGLWSADPDVAFGAARCVQTYHLDLGDIDRYLTAVTPHLFESELRFDIDTYKHVVDTAHLDRVLAAAPPYDAEVRPWYLGALHRSLRPSHVPNLCGLARSPDPIVRREAFAAIANLTQYSTAFPELVVLLLLEWQSGDADPTVAARARREDANPPRTPAISSGSGYASLAAILDGWFASTTVPEQQRGYATFVARSLARLPPQPNDAERVDAALLQDLQVIRLGVLASLATAADIEPFRTSLRMFVRRSDVDPVEIVWARWLLEGSAALRERATTDAAHLLVALHADDESVWRDWAGRAFGESPASSREAIEHLVEAARIARHAPAARIARHAPAAFPEHALLRLRSALEAGAEQLDLDRIETLCAEFPSVRCAALVRRVLDLLATNDQRLGDETAAMLEIHQPERLIAALDARIARGIPGDADTALLARLRIVPADAARWLAWTARTEGGLLALNWRNPEGAAAEFADAVAARFAGLDLASADLDAFASYAAAHGLPRSVAMRWRAQIDSTPDDIAAAGWPHWRDAVVAGRPVDALVDFLDRARAALPHPWVDGLGDVLDERIRARLRRWRNTAGEPAQELILELARAGDPEARAEIDAVLARHIYGWLDDAADDRRALGDLRLLPYWIDELGTICCRRNGAVGAIDALVGYDAAAHPEDGLVSQREAALAWYRRVGARLRWSDLLGRFSVAPK